MFDTNAHIMKRKADSELTESPQRRPPRQDPVSCESCRRKKLKCDRQRPCGSCVTRRLACIYGAGPGPVAADTRKADTQHDRSGTQVSNAGANSHRPLLESSQTPAYPQPTTHESLLTADWLEHIHMADRLPAALSPQLRAEIDEPTSGDVIPGSTIPFNPPGAFSSTIRAGWTPSENPATTNLVSFLPPKAEVLGLFRYYCSYIDYLYHIIIPQHAEEHIHRVYQCVDSGTAPAPDHLALLFSITGSSLYLQLSIESSSHAETSIQQSSFLTGAALLQSNYITYPTIEGLQAALIIMHHVSNVHCHVAVAGLFTTGSIINQAKNLMLHRTDSPEAREERKTRTVDLADLELRRRLWWDIASFDWLLGFLSGPQEWTYLINPKFMHVDKPSNINDTFLATHPPPPPSSSTPPTPTTMTFFLERLKLAEACRSIVDSLSPSYLSGTEPAYTKILSLDRKLQSAQSEAPDFFRLDSSSRRRFAPLYRANPVLAWQRCLLQQAYYSRLCRLHRPFFIRGARDPAYSYSHVICLQSARKVLEIKRVMDEDEPRFTPSSSAIWSIMHHVFMAAVMLLLDVCYNWDDILAEKRKEEVLEACRMLSRAQQSSPVVKEGINAMMGVLQRHYCRGGGGQVNLPAAGQELSVSVSVGVGVGVATGDYRRVENVDEDEGQEDKGLEDIWGEILDGGGNMDFGNEDWVSLFTELNNAAMPAH